MTSLRLRPVVNILQLEATFERNVPLDLKNCLSFSIHQSKGVMLKSVKAMLQIGEDVLQRDRHIVHVAFDAPGRKAHP